MPLDSRLRWLLLMVESGTWFLLPWRSVGIPRGHLVFPEFDLQSGSLLGPAPMEIACLGLLPRGSLARACSHGVRCLRPDPWSSLSQACSCGGGWFAPTLMKVAGLGLLWQRFPTWACSSEGGWLRPVPVSVPVSNLLLQK